MWVRVESSTPQSGALSCHHSRCRWIFLRLDAVPQKINAGRSPQDICFSRFCKKILNWWLFRKELENNLLALWQHYENLLPLLRSSAALRHIPTDLYRVKSRYWLSLSFIILVPDLSQLKTDNLNVVWRGFFFTKKSHSRISSVDRGTIMYLQAHYLFKHYSGPCHSWNLEQLTGMQLEMIAYEWIKFALELVTCDMPV